MFRKQVQQCQWRCSPCTEAQSLKWLLIVIDNVPKFVASTETCTVFSACNCGGVTSVYLTMTTQRVGCSSPKTQPTEQTCWRNTVFYNTLWGCTEINWNKCSKIGDTAEKRKKKKTVILVISLPSNCWNGGKASLRSFSILPSLSNVKGHRLDVLGSPW